MKIGIIGSGRFGTLLQKVFNEHWQDAEVILYSRSKSSTAEMQACAAADILIPAVPIRALQENLQKFKPLLGKNTTVIDVCSVKVLPVKWMQEILGSQASIIASHPMFGPDSTQNGTKFAGLRLMTQNISAPEELFLQWKSFWTGLGVSVTEMSPEQHDKYAAYTINYNHLVGRIGQKIGLQSTPIDTPGFSVICEALKYVTNDSWDLFFDMQRYNPFAREMIESVDKALHEIISDLQNYDNLNSGQ